MVLVERLLKVNDLGALAHQELLEDAELLAGEVNVAVSDPRRLELETGHLEASDDVRLLRRLARQHRIVHGENSLVLRQFRFFLFDLRWQFLPTVDEGLLALGGVAADRLWEAQGGGAHPVLRRLDVVYLLADRRFILIRELFGGGSNGLRFFDHLSNGVDGRAAVDFLTAFCLRDLDRVAI